MNSLYQDSIATIQEDTDIRLAGNKRLGGGVKGIYILFIGSNGFWNTWEVLKKEPNLKGTLSF